MEAPKVTPVEIPQRESQPIAITPVRIPKAIKSKWTTRPCDSKLPNTATLKELYQTRGIKNIGSLYGVSHETVRRRLMAAGIELRPKGRTLGRRR